MALFEWLTANGDALAAALLAAHGLAVIIVNLTPTPKDNEWVAKLYKPIEWLAGILSKKVKE